MKRKIKYGILILFPMLLILMSAVQPVDAQQLAVYTTSEVFNVPIHLPKGTRIDYLRIYFYDKSATYDAQAWVTTYDGAGGLADVAYVTSTGSAGFGQKLSAYSGHVVNNVDYSYVLNWRPRLYSSSVSTSDMQLYGLRVAYCLAADAPPCDNYEYLFVPGVVLTPRSNTTSWSGGFGYGSIHPVYFPTYLPLIKR